MGGTRLCSCANNPVGLCTKYGLRHSLVLALSVGLAERLVRGLCVPYIFVPRCGHSGSILNSLTATDGSQCDLSVTRGTSRIAASRNAFVAVAVEVVVDDQVRSDS